MEGHSCTAAAAAAHCVQHTHCLIELSGAFQESGPGILKKHYVTAYPVRTYLFIYLFIFLQRWIKSWWIIHNVTNADICLPVTLTITASYSA